MRVITGLAKGKRLTAPEGKDTTRPTAEKVKEGVFSAIQFLLERRRCSISLRELPAAWD
jgi:16S rRNA G966 N2-methylase RsmD